MSFTNQGCGSLLITDLGALKLIICAIVVSNLKYVLIVDVIIEGFGRIRQWTATIPFPANSGLGVPCHLCLECCIVTYK